MYLPRNLPLSRPHVAMWIGESGKRYDFAVCRPGTICVDEPAVYILARHEEQVATPLFVGHTTSLHRHFGLSRERCPEAWRRAVAIGMTHVHLRFDTFSKMTREAEVTDLVAALAPVLNDQLVLDEERSLPALEIEAAASARIDRTREYHRERREVGGRVQSPALATVGSGRHVSAERAVPPPLFRADPAREDDGEPGDFELPVAAIDAPPDGQLRADMRPTTVTFERLEEEVEIVQLAPAEPAATPDAQRRPDGRLTAARLPESADVVRTTDSAKSAQLQRLIARVREFVARMRAPRRPDALDDAGSAELPPVPAAAPALPVILPAATGPAELYARTGEPRDTVLEDTGEASRYRARRIPRQSSRSMSATRSLQKQRKTPFLSRLRPKPPRSGISRQNAAWTSMRPRPWCCSPAIFRTTPGWIFCSMRSSRSVAATKRRNSCLRAMAP